MIARTWSVYTLSDSRSPDDVRYIGITSQPRRRLRDHKRTHTNTHRSRWVHSVLGAGADVVMVVIVDGLSRDDAISKEIEAIAQYREAGANLTNSTQGGDGVVGKTPRVLARMSEIARRNTTPDVIARLQSALRRPEVITRKIEGIRAAMTSDVKRRIGNAHRGKVVSQDTRKKISAACRGYKFTHDQHERLLVGLRHASIRQDNTSGYRGVSFDARRGKWHAYINVSGRRKYVGRFKAAHDAALARDEAAYREFGADCRLNFPEKFASHSNIEAEAA